VTAERTGTCLPINIDSFKLRFVRWDFTTDLIAKNAEFSDVSDDFDDSFSKSVICKFKPSVSHLAFTPVLHGHASRLVSDSITPVIRSSNEEYSSFSALSQNLIPRELLIPNPVSSPIYPEHSNSIRQSFNRSDHEEGDNFGDNGDTCHKSDDYGGDGDIYHKSSLISSDHRELFKIVRDQHDEINRLRNYINILRKIITDQGVEYPDFYVEEIIPSTVAPVVDYRSIAEKEEAVNIATEDVQFLQTIEAVIEDEELIMKKYLTEDDKMEIRSLSDLDWAESRSEMDSVISSSANQPHKSYARQQTNNITSKTSSGLFKIPTRLYESEVS
jgi:hypothetical protein